MKTLLLIWVCLALLVSSARGQVSGGVSRSVVTNILNANAINNLNGIGTNGTFFSNLLVTNTTGNTIKLTNGAIVVASSSRSFFPYLTVEGELECHDIDFNGNLANGGTGGGIFSYSTTNNGFGDLFFAIMSEYISLAANQDNRGNMWLEPLTLVTVPTAFCTNDGSFIGVNRVFMGPTVTNTPATGMTLEVSGSVQLDNTIANYNSKATVDQGVPPIYASVHALAQVAAINATTLYTPTTTNGLYRISGCIAVVTAGSGTNATQIVFQGAGNGAATTVTLMVQNVTGTMQTTNSVPLTAQGQFSFVPIVIQSTNAVIQYKTVNNIGGSAKYDLHLSLEALRSQ